MIPRICDNLLVFFFKKKKTGNKREAIVKGYKDAYNSITQPPYVSQFARRKTQHKIGIATNDHMPASVYIGIRKGRYVSGSVCRNRTSDPNFKTVDIA